MRVVADMTVLVAAIRSDRGASRRLLLVAGLEERVRFLVSVPLMFEYQAVMTRLEHLRASGLNESDVTAILDGLAASAEPVHLAFLWRPFARDPDDDMVLEAAVNGHADVIVTFNRRDFVGVREAFGVSVLTPAETVERMEKWT